MAAKINEVDSRQFVKLFADGKKPTQEQFKAYVEYLIRSDDQTDKDMLDIIGRMMKSELASRAK